MPEHPDNTEYRMFEPRLVENVVEAVGFGKGMSTRATVIFDETAGFSEATLARMRVSLAGVSYALNHWDLARSTDKKYLPSDRIWDAWRAHVERLGYHPRTDVDPDRAAVDYLNLTIPAQPTLPGKRHHGNPGYWQTDANGWSRNWSTAGAYEERSVRPLPVPLVKRIVAGLNALTLKPIPTSETNLPREDPS